MFYPAHSAPGSPATPLSPRLLHRIEVSLEGGSVTVSAELTMRSAKHATPEVWRLFGR